MSSQVEREPLLLFGVGGMSRYLIAYVVCTRLSIFSQFQFYDEIKGFHKLCCSLLIVRGILSTHFYGCVLELLIYSSGDTESMRSLFHYSFTIVCFQILS